MPSPIEEFPPELLASVVANLSSNDLCSLMRVSKAHHVVLQPFLWSNIEMHYRNFHSRICHDALHADEVAKRKEPPYDNGPEDSGKRYGSSLSAERVQKFLQIFSPNGFPKDSKLELGSLVKSLCLPVHDEETKFREWTCFENFSNLGYLEISAFWTPYLDPMQFSAPECSLTKLRVLKLRGYIPKEFVQWLLREPAGLEELQLGVLDRPIGGNCEGPDGWENPPPPENKHPYDMDQLSERERAYWESTENLDHMYVGARALACLTPDIMRRFENLKTLYLCRPSSGEETISEVYFSEPSDRRILEEWNALLTSTRGTLESVILDQRPSAEENEPDGTGNNEFMRQCANGPSYKRFVEMVLPTLIESKEWPKLKTVRLFGFERHDEGSDNYTRTPNYPNDSVDVPGQLKAAFPGVDISDHIGRRFLTWNTSGELMSAGDVLETPNAFDDGSDEEVEKNDHRF